MSRRFSTLDRSTMDQKEMTNDVRLKLAKVRARSRSICVPAPPPLANASFIAGSELKKSKRTSQVPRPSITAMTTSAKAKIRSPYTNAIDRPTTNNHSPPPPNTLEPNNNNRRRHSATSNNNIKSAQWNEDPTLLRFFDSDSDEDELFLRNKVKETQSHEKCQRRATIATSAHVDNADKNHNQSMRAELQELKSRLARLEAAAAPTNKKTTTTSAINKRTTLSEDKLTATSDYKPITTTNGKSRRTSANGSLTLSPQSSLVDSACSVSNKTQVPNRYEEILQSTVLHLETLLQQSGHGNDTGNKTKNTLFMDTLIALVAETMNINQSLGSLASRQQVTSDDLLDVKKSSDHQINLLTETLQALHQQPQQKQHHDQDFKPQHQAMDPLASPPLSHSGSINSGMGMDDSPKPTKHRVLFSSPIAPPHLKKSNHAMDHSMHKNQPSSSSSSTDKKRYSTDSHNIKSKDHEVTPTRHQHTKSVNGIVYYPHQHQQEHEITKKQPFYSLPSVVKQKTNPASHQAFQPMSSFRGNQLLSKYESLLKPTTTTSIKSATARQHHVDRDRFPSFIDY